MGKDPAMLWYWSDWNSGTSLMSRFLKGCYMDLLHAQFNHGHLSLEEIKTCLGADFGSAWPTLQKKFKQAETGLFFNERLDEEKLKRKNFCESRRNNLKSATHDPPYESHTGERMEDVNKNKNTIKDSFEKGAGKTFEEQAELSLPVEHLNHRTRLMNDKANREVIEVQCRGVTVSDDLLITFNAHLLTEEVIHKKFNDYLKHLRNWIPVKLKTDNASHQNNNRSTAKQPEGTGPGVF